MKRNILWRLSWHWITWPTILTFSIVFITYFLTSLIKLDPDFGWHLKSGEYFIKHGIPAHDIFTYTAAGFPWINHEWLSDVFIATLFPVVGYIGLCAIFAGLWTLAIWLVGRRSHNLLVLLAVFATLPFSGVRAITWSVLGIAVFITILNAKKKKYRWLLPLLMLVWANVHGSFIIGIAYGIYVSVKERSWRLAALIGVCVLVAFFNPYGSSIYIEVWRTVTDVSLKWRITEWQPLYIPWLTVGFFLAWSSAFALTDMKKWREYLGTDFLAFLTGVSSMRNLVLFVILALPVTSDRLRRVAATIPKDLDKPRRRFVAISGAIVICAVLWLVTWSYWGVSLDREAHYPRKAVAYLKIHPCRGNLFNDYNYGGYLIWQLPSHKVYIDGRMPSWELDGHKYMDEYLDIIEKSDVLDEKFRQYDIQCALVENSKKDMIKDLKKAHWRVAVGNSDSVLLVSQ